MTVSRRPSANSSSAASALREGLIWKETASLLTEVHSQARLDRSSPRSSWTRQPVSSAWRSAALFWCARIGRAWRQGQQRDVIRNDQPRRHVPTGLIENQHGVGAGLDSLRDFPKMRLHGMGIAVRHDQSGALALRRANGAEYVDPLGTLVVRRSGPRPAPCPAAGDLVLLTDAGLVLEPDFDFLAAGARGAGSPSQWQGSFFTRFDRFRVLRMMPGPSRELAEPHRAQLPAQRLSAHGKPEFVPQPLRQIG